MPSRTPDAYVPFSYDYRALVSLVLLDTNLDPLFSRASVSLVTLVYAKLVQTSQDVGAVYA